MKVIVENEFWSLFPEAQISVLVVKGLDNTVDESKDSYFKTLLDKGAKRAEDFRMRILLRMMSFKNGVRLSASLKRKKEHAPL